MEKELLTVVEDTQNDVLISVAEDIGTVPSGLPTMPPKPELLPTKPIAGEEEKKVEQESDDWRESKKSEHFSPYLERKLTEIPTPSAARGNQALMERALGQYTTLNNQISKAMRDDFDCKIDALRIDKLRIYVEKCIDELETMLDSIAKLKGERRKMRRADDEADLVKEAGTPHFSGIQMQVTAFQSAVVRILINGTVAGGHNMEELYKQIKNKYTIDDKEELGIIQVLADFGYPIFQDRLRIGEKDVDTTKSDESGEWSATYHA